MLHKILVPLALLAAFFHGPTYTQVVEKAQTSVLHILGSVTDDDGNVGHYSCTGFAIAKRRVLTAAHCNGKDMTADGIHAILLKADVQSDLMLLEVGTGRKPMTFRDTPVVRFEELTAIGYGYGWHYLTVLTVHPILVDVTVEGMAPGMFVQGGYIGGMSGGPVIDMDGYVVGIVQRTSEGVGYGVTALTIKAFLLGT